MNYEIYKSKVSILVAAYNVERYIEKCVNSIIKQTYTNIEIIIVNDSSNDRTGEICNDLAKTDSRIKVLNHKANLRLPAVRNTGLDNATGEYVAFVDGDDWLAPDFVEYLLYLIEDTKSEMAISKSIFTTRDTKQNTNDHIEIWNAERATADLLFSKITIGAWNKLYRREFIEKNHLRFRKELFTAEGFRFINDCAQRVKQVAVGNRKIYYYRLNNANSATTFPDIRQGLGSLSALDGIERDLIIRTPMVLISLEHHRWHNYMYTLQIILESNSKKVNKELYTKCIKYIKKNGIKVALNMDSPKHTIFVLIKSLFPVIWCKFWIWRKYRELNKDIME